MRLETNLYQLLHPVTEVLRILRLGKEGRYLLTSFLLDLLHERFEALSRLPDHIAPDRRYLLAFGSALIFRRGRRSPSFVRTSRDGRHRSCWGHGCRLWSSSEAGQTSGSVTTGLHHWQIRRRGPGGT